MEKSLPFRAFLVVVLVAWCKPAGPTVWAADPAERAKTLELDAATGRWIEKAPPIAGTPQGDLDLVRELHANGEHDKAFRAIKKWFKTYGEDHELYPNAVLVRAKIQVARRDYYKAHQELQSFLSRYAGTRYADQAIQIEFIIAERFLSGTKRKFWGMRLLKADDIGIAILDDLAANYPDSSVAELAILTKASYYFTTGDFAFAEHEYTTLMSRFPRSRYTRKSLIQTARAALASFGGIEYDDAPLIEAYERYRQYLVQYQGAAEEEGVGLILDDISETRAAKELNIADYYVRAGHDEAARFYYRSTIDNWPDSIAAVRAADRLSALGEEVDGAPIGEASELPKRSGPDDPVDSRPSPGRDGRRSQDPRRTEIEREAMRDIMRLDQPDNE